MATNRISAKTAALSVAVGLAAIAIFAPACSSDNSKPETTPVFGTGGAGSEDDSGAGGSNGGGKSSTGGKSPTGGRSSAGGSATDIDGGEDASAAGGSGGESDAGTGGTDAGTCDLPLGAHDCYPCDPVTNDQFLNHCGGTCYPFDNAARLGANWNDGKLIDLP